MRPVPQPIGTPYGATSPKGKPWALGRHTGRDLLAPTGTTVVAPRDSKIIHAGRIGWGTSYGIQVVGECTVGGVTYQWITAHMMSVSVSVGQLVAEGQPIGISNNTGNTGGPHVHDEVRHYPFNFGDDVNPDVLDQLDVPPVAKPKPGAQTVFDVCFWNVASPKWFTPWAPRATGIGNEIRGEASVYGFAEVYDETQAATIQKAIGATFLRVSGHAGAELFYDSTKWQLEREPYKGGYASGVQGRYALIVHLTRKETGQHVCFVVVHGPVTYDSLKTRYGQWLAKLLGQIDGPIVLMGDFNRSVNTKSPRKEVRAMGFRDMREQAAIKNEGSKEFPGKGWNLSDIYTIPSGPADIVGGEIDITPANLSDHRRIEARVTVTAP